MGAAPDPVGTLRAEYEALERAYSAGHHGVWAARRRAGLVDVAIAELFARAGAPPGTAVAAVGGYGRSLLLPRSDIDLLIVHEGVDGDVVSGLADALLYPFWNVGFDVGHAVRTPEECERARDRLDAEAAMLDVRAVGGEPSLVADVRRRVSSWAGRDPRRFVAAIRDDAARRADRFGSSAHLLEPDLKEGSGGWRDLHAIELIVGVVGPGAGGTALLRSRERDALDGALEFLARARSALHLETRKPSDRLVLDHQPAIAAAMGFEDEPRLIAIDGLMRALFEHARQVEFTLRTVIARFLEEASESATVPTTTGAALGALADAAEADREPAAALLDATEDLDPPEGGAWTDDERSAFLRLLRAGPRGSASLEILDRLGVLDRLIPAWADVRCRPQRDPYHRFTVDTHLTATLGAMGRILVDETDDDPVRAEAVKQVSDRDALLLGSLLHDIGKTGEGGHVAVGSRVIGPILQRIGLPDHTASLVRFMVSQHLLLPDTATRRDLSDEDLILDVAAAVGSQERLAALYLLARADAEATGPAAWTPWRATLVRELVAKVQRVLERGEMGPEVAGELAARMDRLRDLLRDAPADEVDRFLSRMPRSYLLTVEPDRVARHVATIAPPVGAREVRAVHLEGARAGASELLVVARDRPGLLSWIAGALSLAGLSILSAQVFTTTDGVAVDVFAVEGAWEDEIPERRWREFRGMLRRAVEGTISLEYRVNEKRRWYPAPSVTVPVTVAIDNGASDFATVIEVGAADRLGLLYDITRVFADLGLDVHLAKVATYEGRVVDSFYVRDALGRKLADDPADVERAVRRELA
ncbi:MAG TPA: ACT domain-containing protein [Actinomycetota bacterium]|nr:ACT domain-containing protein [Actinomycetota bacterium]